MNNPWCFLGSELSEFIILFLRARIILRITKNNTFLVATGFINVLQRIQTYVRLQEKTKSHPVAGLVWLQESPIPKFIVLLGPLCCL